MAIKPLNHHYSMENPASIFDEEAMTALELAGRTTAKVNECVQMVNNIPETVAQDVQKHIDSGKFDDQVDKYAGQLKQQIRDSEAQIRKEIATSDTQMDAQMDAMETRLNKNINTVNARVDGMYSIPTGSTSLDAELIDLRTDYNGNTHASAGTAIRTAFTEGKRDWYQNVGAYGYHGWADPLTYEIYAQYNGTTCFRVNFKSYASVRAKGSIYTIRFTDAAIADIKDWIVKTSESRATIYIPTYKQYVYNIVDEMFHFREGANLLSGDISLIKTGWGYPVGGTLMDEYVIRSIDLQRVEIENIKTGISNSGEKPYEPTDLISGIGNSYRDVQDGNCFLFFTDPHLMGSYGGNDWRADFDTAIRKLADDYVNTPAQFVVCGGDWLNHGDTRAEASYKLGVINGVMRKTFGDDYYPVVGNHDTNYQGKAEAGMDSNTGELSAMAINNLWNLQSKQVKTGTRNYYTFETKNTLFIVLDTHLDWTGATFNTYFNEQLEWLAGVLKNNDKDNVVIFAHMYYVDDNGTVNYLAQNTLRLAHLFNERAIDVVTEETLKGVDFTGTKGYVRFFMCGHNHRDFVETPLAGCSIPVICTTNLGSGSADYCVADYKTGKLTLHRTLNGDSRVVDLPTF